MGAGREAIQADALRRDGFQVAAIELGANWRRGIHDAEALHAQFDIVRASNVLNVQVSARMLTTTLRIVAGLLEINGEFIANYPTLPRKLGWSDERLLSALRRHFRHVTSLTAEERLGYSGRVVRCCHPRYTADTTAV